MSIQKKIKLIWITSRPQSSFLSGIATLIILLSQNENSIFKYIFQSLPIVLATMVGFILNDVYDYEKDKTANKDRPIALGILDRNLAINTAFVLSFVSIVITLFFCNLSSVFFIILLITGLIFYSPISKHLPVIKGFITALLTTSPIAYGSIILKMNFPFYFYISIVIFIIGREILLDTKDLVSDTNFGLKTIPYYFGLNISRLISWLLMSIGLLYYFLELSSLISQAIIGIGTIIFLVALIMDLDNSVPHAGLTKATMLFFVLSIPYSI
jgi:4-hydroxybenzoate polyprenyltransferase